MSQDNAAILADTAAHGFDFVESEVSTDQGDVSLGVGPVLVVTDLVKFEASFPGRIAAMLDGSSARVLSQARIRRERAKDSRITFDSLKVKVLDTILGVRAKSRIVREVEIYILPDGTSSRNEAEALAAWQAKYAKGPGTSDAAKVLGTKLNQ